MLKPQDDPRMVLRQAAVCRPFSEVFVFGAPVLADLPAGIRYFSSRPANFGKISRLAACREFIKILFRIRPDCLLVNAPDLLPAAVFYRFWTGKKVIYDIRENYRSNFLYQENRPVWKRKILAGLVRLTENFCANFTDAFVLAEKSYHTELPFLRPPILLYENKFQAPEKLVFPSRPAADFSPENPRFIISGTLNRTYGILRGIKWFLALNAQIPRARLTLIGSCRNDGYRKEIESLCKNKFCIKLIISNLTITYQKIINEIRENDFALMPYLPDKSTENCIPSKIYEYAVFGLPTLQPANKLWEEKMQKIGAYAVSDFSPEKARTDYENLCRLQQNPAGFSDKKAAINRSELFTEFIKKIIVEKRSES